MSSIDYECPGPDCPSCNGEACDFCGAGCWNNNPKKKCEHDVLDRHDYAGKDEAAFQRRARRETQERK